MNTKVITTALLLLALLLTSCMGLGRSSTQTATINLADATPATVKAPVAATAADATTAKVVAAAEALLATLDEPLRAKVLFAFDDDTQRANWSNLPTGIFQRAGLRMGDLSEEQKAAVFALLAATLSEHGYQQVLETVAGDEVLKSTDGGGNLIFGQDEYYISILGTPSATDPWMWQFGGHHLAINATIVGGTIVLNPSLTGGQPVQYTLDGREVRQLVGDNDKSFVLINALDAEQQKVAILGDSYIDLVLGAGQDGKTLAPEGIQASALTPEQQTLLLDLIGERVNLLNADDAAVKMAEVEANLAETWFAWYGPTTDGEAAYYRIQGPTLLIEYSPQQMGGSAINHIHAIYRDPTNDYGAGLLGQ